MEVLMFKSIEVTYKESYRELGLTFLLRQAPGAPFTNMH